MSRKHPPAAVDLARYRLAVKRRLRQAGIATEIDWGQVDAVVGTREDLTFSGLKRDCATCGEPVYTSQPYPDDVAVVCLECAGFLEEETSG